MKWKHLLNGHFLKDKVKCTMGVPLIDSQYMHIARFLPNSRVWGSEWQTWISSSEAFLGLTRAHLWASPVSTRRAQIDWRRPLCSGCHPLSPQVHACFSMAESNASPVVTTPPTLFNKYNINNNFKGIKFSSIINSNINFL